MHIQKKWAGENLTILERAPGEDQTGCQVSFWRVDGAAMDEETCAEGARDYFNQDAEPIPQANKPDF